MLSSTVDAAVLIADQVAEYYSEKVKVSGKLFSGIQINDSDKVDELFVYLPEASKKTLCTELTSIDGRYKGTLEKKLDGSASGFVKVEFDSKYENILTSYDGNSLAALSYLSSSCEGDFDRKYLVSSWKNQPHKNELLVLIRSSARKDKASINGSDKYQKCKKIRDKYSVSFDKFCVMPIEDFTKLKKLDLKRKNLQPIDDAQLRFAYSNEKE